MNLDGRVALVTGGASGIGAATTRRLAGLGATVVVADIDDHRGEELVAELGTPHHYCHLDVSDLDAWRSTLARLAVDVGPLDILHLNAGIMSRSAGAPSLDDPLTSAFTAEVYRRVMAVNTDGVVYGILAALPHLEGRAVDIVVTVSALTGAAPDPIYGVSKIALVGLVWGLAPSLASRSVRLNAICPGLTETALISSDIIAMARDFIQPASYIADAVVAVLESPSNGTVWFAAGPEIGLWRVEPPSLPMAVGRSEHAGLSGWALAPAPSAPAPPRA